jgi:hypothetical protein
MQDQDRVGISDAMSSELYSKLMLSGNQRPDIRDSSSGPDISYGSSSLVLQQHVRTGSAPPQLDNMSGSPFFAEGGTKGAFFGNATTGASQMGYDTAGFRSNVSDDRYSPQTSEHGRETLPTLCPTAPAMAPCRKHAGTVDTAKLLHHKMKPMDARGMPMSASGGDVRSQLWLNKAAAEGKTWAQQVRHEVAYQQQVVKQQSVHKGVAHAVCVIPLTKQTGTCSPRHHRPQCWLAPGSLRVPALPTCVNTLPPCRTRTTGMFRWQLAQARQATCCT